jgi:hypothetical protein
MSKGDMKSSVFWDTTPCSPFKFNLTSGGIYRLHFQGQRISQARNQRESRWQEILKMEETYSSETSFDLIGLQFVISQKTEFFITTYVTTSYST